MKVSLEWLSRYVDVDVDVQTLCRKLTMAGFEIEGVEDQAASMENVVAARILTLAPHPNADRLQICTVDAGGAPVQIITGADNIFEGALVPAALDGARLPNGMRIKKGNLRGLPSDGMLCSGEELLLKEADYPGAGVHGILILNENCAPGADLRDVLGLRDVILDVSITANRPDCNCIIGIAREVAAILNKPLRLPEPAYQTVGGDIGDHMRVEVADAARCPRYYGRVVRSVRLAPSPGWMQRSLKAAGMRPINNMVDITNFVMLETGHPMHAFDLRDVAGGRLHVRCAAAGETITTLDEKPHALEDDMLVIADDKGPSCIAGVMGGLHSEIKHDTTEIFLECAKFRRDSVRRTARRLGMRTESSARFERGVDAAGVPYAMERALQLVYELDAGDIVDGAIDRCAAQPPERVLTVPAAHITRLLGIDIPAGTMARLLNRLSIESSESGGVLTCKIPPWREDVEGAADLAEEVMRIYGYEHLDSAPMTGLVVRGRKTDALRKTCAVKDRLCAAGLHEAMTYSFISRKAADSLLLPEDDPRRSMLALRNPLGEEYAVMRTQLVSSMLGVLATNYNRRNEAAGLFELADCFLPNGDQLPEERPALCIGLYGPEADFYVLKGLVDAVAGLWNAAPDYAPSAEPYLHPGRQARASVGGKTVALLGEAHPAVAQSYNIGVRAYIAQIDLAVLYALPDPVTRYRPLPRYPAVVRDFAVVCDRALPYASLEAAVRAGAGELCEAVALFDVYSGAQVPEGRKSVALRVTLRAAGGTLTEEDAAAATAGILEALAAAGATLRQ